MVTHIVMWKFSSSADMQEAKSRLETLPKNISEIITFEVGEDFNRSAAAFDLVLYSTFEDRESLTAYQIHPAHVEVAQFIGSVATSRGVVDYEK